MCIRDRFSEWRSLQPATDSKEEAQEASHAREELKSTLLSSLQMQHVTVLAGSGTSLGESVKGPSMWTLWDNCVNDNPDTGHDQRKPSAVAREIIQKIEFDEDDTNIEALLSRCDAYQQIYADEAVESFITSSKATILRKCTEFIESGQSDQLNAHRTFLHRMSRRRVRDSRLKLFTTNYDLCFEKAASTQGIVALDGFSFTEPRLFDPRFFQYDIIRKPIGRDELGTPLEGVFHLYKLHGSVNWSRSSGGDVVIDANPDPQSAALIYPAYGKYQQSYVQPHLELMSRYLGTLREPNTCMIILGFGFNDDHLSEPIVAAVKSNPHLRLIVVNPSADEFSNSNSIRRTIFQLASEGEDVWLVNATFSDFAAMIPDLKSLTPAQRLQRDIASMVNN